MFPEWFGKVIALWFLMGTSFLVGYVFGLRRNEKEKK